MINSFNFGQKEKKDKDATNEKSKTIDNADNGDKN
jgi:hypothetical protein